MSTEKRTEISSLGGEFKLIEHLVKPFNNKQSSTLKGVGDDAAVIENTMETTVVSTDLLIDGIHFDLIYTPLKHLGYKAVSVNVSDIYAMNAIPTQITVSIAISNRFSVEGLEEFYEGVRLACEVYNVDLVGGDTTASNKGFLVSVTALGQAPKKQIVHRNTARVGDLICVTGDLGGAYLGLQLLEREKQVFLADPNMQPQLQGNQYMIGRILKPEARKDIINFFHTKNLKPTSMIDISDGLSSELFHIATQSGVGVEVEEAKIPIGQDVYNLAVDFNHDPTTCALNGGEDYELLFTISPSDEEIIKTSGLDISIIGKITEKENGLFLRSKTNRLHKLVAQGWQHI